MAYGGGSLHTIPPTVAPRRLKPCASASTAPAGAGLHGDRLPPPASTSPWMSLLVSTAWPSSVAGQLGLLAPRNWRMTPCPVTREPRNVLVPAMVALLEKK